MVHAPLICGILVGMKRALTRWLARFRPLPSRRPHETHQLGKFTVRFGRHPITGEIVEVFFDQREKAGTELNQFLHDAGVLISKVLQGKEVA